MALTCTRPCHSFCHNVFFTNKSVYLIYESHGNNTNRIKKKLEVFSEISVIDDTSKLVNPSPVDIIVGNSENSHMIICISPSLMRLWVSSLILKDASSNESFLLFHNIDEFPKRWMASRKMQL